MIVTDQMGNQIHLSAPPQRIISLVPSQTELLFDLGLDDRIVGVTQFCEHPQDKVKTKTKIGGTKRFNFRRIAALQPDLIIGNKEENYQSGIERLQQSYPVWMSDIATLEDAYAMMTSLGELTGKKKQALALIKKIEQGFETLAQFQSTRLKKIPLHPRVAYLIWRKPYMVVGRHTFIQDMLSRCGFINVFEHLDRYPAITNEELINAEPDIILLSSEPYPFRDKHIAELQDLCPQAKILLVDGQMFSWYGSRLQFASGYFGKLTSEFMT